MDKLTPERRSKNMRAIRSKGMVPEIFVRSLIHGMGYRYRLHNSKLPGRPDLVFSSRNKVIFIHGCFWHQHKDCRGSIRPKSNVDFWNTKLDRTIERDSTNIEVLAKANWKVLVAW